MSNDAATTILVVDDEPPICELLARYLQPEGYSVLIAGSVDQALNLLDGQRVDLILLDLHMPGAHDGEELLFDLRDRGSDVPIIVVSGWVDDEATLVHPDCVHGVVKKPVNREALLAMVRQTLV